MASAPAAAASSAPPSLVKVFVGNLSFKTREAELGQAFSVAGKVLQANIITRGPRSLGYGFVEFGSEAEAKKSVELLNKKEIDGREINVEVAKPRDETAAAAAAEGGRRGGRGRGRGRGRGGAGAGAGAGGAGAGAGAPPGDYLPPRRARGARAPRAPRPAPAPGAAPRTNSTTTLFVANLPFAVDDKQLSELFKDFNPVTAHVVMKRNGKSKGFGFVEFKSQDDQTKALALDKKECQGRELIVKVALSDQVPPQSAPAAAAPASSPATPKK